MGHENLHRRHGFRRQAPVIPVVPVIPVTPVVPVKPVTPVPPVPPANSDPPKPSSPVPSPPVPSSPSLPVIPPTPSAPVVNPTPSPSPSVPPSKPSPSPKPPATNKGGNAAGHASSSSTPTPVPTLTATDSNVGGIVGGVLGGLALAAVACFAIFFFIKRQKKNKRKSRVDDGGQLFSPNKFRRSAVVLDGSDHGHDRGAQLMTERGPEGTITPYTDYPGSVASHSRTQGTPSIYSSAPSTVLSPPPSTYGHTNGSFYNPHPATSTISSVALGMPQDSAYNYQGQPVLADQFGRQTPAGYAPMKRSPMHVHNIDEGDELPPPAYQDATRGEVPVQVSEKGRRLGPVVGSSMPAVGSSSVAAAATPSATATGTARRPNSIQSTIYNPDDVYGGI